MPQDTIRRATIAAAIKARLETVTGIKNVYDQEYLTATIDDMIPKYMDTDEGRELHTWLIRRVRSLPETSESSPGRVVIGRQVWWYHTFEIRFDYSWESGKSESVFQQLLDDVLYSFASQRTLGGFTTETVLSLDRVTTDEFKNFQVHRAMFSLTVIDVMDGITPQ